MYKVSVMGACSCFIKNGLADIQDFTTKDEAKVEAEALFKKIQTSFCSKHDFAMTEQFGSFTILTKARR